MKSNQEIMELIQENDLLEDLIDILIENDDYSDCDDLTTHDHAIDIAKDLLTGIGVKYE